MAEAQEAKDSIFKAKVLEHKQSGMMVLLPDASMAWLPYGELSYQKTYEPSDRPHLERLHEVGSSVECIILEESITDKALRVVSVAAAKDNPWSNPDKVPRWVRERTARIMVVTNTAHSEYFMGYIEPGVEARMFKHEFRRALVHHQNDTFFGPRTGDRLAGLVVSADTTKRTVTLSMEALLGGCGTGMEGSPERCHARRPLMKYPDDAITLLAASSETEMRRKLEETAGILADLDCEGAPPPSFRRVFVLDDEEDVAAVIGDMLIAGSFDVEKVSTLTAARSFWGLPDPDLENTAQGKKKKGVTPVRAIPYPLADVALIDVDLTKGNGGGALGGIEFARELQRLHPYCPILLMTAKSYCSEMAKAARGIFVSDLMYKPLSRRELMRHLGIARNSVSRDAHDFIMERVANTPRSAWASSVTGENVKGDFRELSAKLDELRKGAEADSAFLFSMEPVTYKTRVLAEAGVPMANWTQFRDRLSKSPVYDVCLGHHRKSKTWYDPDATSHETFGKHRYLLYCYSAQELDCRHCQAETGLPCFEHMYHSCAATHVASPQGERRGYGVFVIAKRPYAFMTGSVLWRVRLAACEIAAILARRHRQAVDERNFPFLMSGLSATTVGHDLLNNLNGIGDIETTLEELQGLSQTISAVSLDKSMNRLKRSHRMLALAREIARNYRDLARDQSVQAEPCVLLDLIQKGREASQGELELSATQVYQVELAEKDLAEAMVHVRRSAMWRVFQNIFNNAAQQVRLRGTLPGCVAIDLSRQEQIEGANLPVPHLRIDIIDTGPGIHWGERERLFEPQVTSRPDGSGMGLHMVRQEIERSGGSIEFTESVLGIGSRITIVLPYLKKVNECTKGDS